MNIDGMIRETLHSYADGAPPSAGLLDAAAARARRRRMRHAGVAAAAATAAVALAVSVLYGTPIGDGPVVLGSGPPPVELVEASYDVPAFPFTPGWLPDGVEPPQVHYSEYAGIEASLVERLERSLPNLVLVHPVGESGGILATLAVEIYAADPGSYFEPDEESPITVQGQPGTRYVGEEGHVFIVWQHEPGQWVRVWADRGIAPADVERYAQELATTPLPADPPFTFDLLPEGLELYDLGTDHMSFHSRDGMMFRVDVGWNEQAVGPILTSPTPSVEPSMEPSPDVSPEASPGEFPTPSAAPARVSQVEVNGRPAELTERSDTTSISIYLEQDWVLSVSGSLNRDDLLRVAEGIGVTDAAHPFGVPVIK